MVDGSFPLMSIWFIFRITDAEENLGESEVREAYLAKSLYYIQIGDKVVNNYIIRCYIFAALFISISFG